jgi:hypothetical protein
MIILLSNSKFYYIAQKIQLFLQWQFVSEIPCNPQTYGMRARKDFHLCFRRKSKKSKKIYFGIRTPTTGFASMKVISN